MIDREFKQDALRGDSTDEARIDLSEGPGEKGLDFDKPAVFAHSTDQ